MPEALPNLPEFDRPPVVETVLSAQFEPIAALSVARFGLFWNRIRDEFPQTETRQALEPAIETFDSLAPTQPRLRLEMRSEVPPVRQWFINAAGTELIQLQNDRFLKNWRKSAAGDVYPRYQKAIKPGFDRHFRVLSDWLQSESLGDARVTQCEVTYVNHIVSGEGWERWSEAATVFPFLHSMPVEIEDGAFFLRLPIRWQERQVGRLSVEIHPALRATDQRPIYVMNLTARGQIGGACDFFDIGREAVVTNFARLTSAHMHEIWGRKK